MLLRSMVLQFYVPAVVLLPEEAAPAPTARAEHLAGRCGSAQRLVGPARTGRYACVVNWPLSISSTQWQATL
jgi:hypothetical protein